MKFAIKHTTERAKKEGDLVLRFSGNGEPFNRYVERTAQVTKTDKMGDPIEWEFVTGLDEDKVDFYKWLTDEEKNVVKKTIKDFKPNIIKYYGSESRLEPTNYAFWKKDSAVSGLKVSHETVDVILDTENPPHALLYLSVVAGAFSDIVAPNKDWADRFQIPHYLALEEDLNDFSDEEEITRSDAHGELASIRKEFGKDALYILAWCLQYEMAAFGAYKYSDTEKDLINYHIKYIDGKLPMKGMKKKNFPKTFMEYAEKWRGAQTRKLLYTEAYVKAGEYYNFITQREKKFVTSDGTILGNTVAEAVESLQKQKFALDLQKLRDQVEAKWKE